MMDSETLSEETFSETESAHICDDDCLNKIELLNSNMEEHKSILENRLESLKNYLVELKCGLAKERELWKKEIEELSKLSKLMEFKNFCVCGEPENFVKLQQTTEVQPTLNDMSILDYEQKLSLYQDALIRAHAEKKMHLRRHFAAHAYKTKLLEVENMCNLELMKVRQNVQFLQPLQAIASEWNFDQPVISNNLDDEITGRSKLKHDIGKRDSNSGVDSFGSVVNMELKELADRLTPINSNFGTTSSLIQEDDEDILLHNNFVPAGNYYWIKNDKNNAFNPLM